MEVYLDVLILENLLMNYLILALTARLLGRPCKARRLILGAGVGAGYAVLFLFWPLLQENGAAVMLCKAFLSFGMVELSFGPRLGKGIGKTLACFYGVSFLFAGIAFGVILLGVPIGSIQGGSFTLHWNAPFNYLVLVAGCGWIFVRVLQEEVRERRRLTRCLVELYIEWNGQNTQLPALIDTGNELRDPVSGLPVVLVEAKALEGLLPNGLQGRASWDAVVEEALEGPVWSRQFRLVPYQSLGCPHGLLLGFRPDCVSVGRQNQEKDICGAQSQVADALVCLVAQPLSKDGKYRALLAPEWMPG